MSKDVKLLIACHKVCEVPDDSMYLPMHVGSLGKEEIPGFTRDDSGDSISGKNPVYCELTGLYWAWKHMDCDYLGLVHYRRYFTIKSKSYQKQHPLLESVLSEKEAQKLLSRYKVLLPKKRRYYIESVYSHYDHTFDGKQFDVAREVLQELDPDSVHCFDKLMKQTSAYIFNMFIMPKPMADEYCSWLFQILEEAEKRYDTSGMTDFEKRWAGRVSERLMNVWLMRQIELGKLKKEEICELPYLYMGEIDWKRKIESFIKAKLFGIKYEKSF